MNINAFDSVMSNYFEEYFYLDGLSNTLGARRFEVFQVQNHHYVLTEASEGKAEILLTILKVASYFTIIIPVVMLLGKIAFRCQNTFEIQQNPLAERAFAELEPEFANPLTGRVTVGSYNILFPQSIPPNRFSSNIGYSVDRQTGQLYNNIDFRMDIIRKNILNSDLDIVCLQEVTEETFQTLVRDLGHKYNLEFRPHIKNSHGVAILHRKEKFERLGGVTGTIDLSVPNPQKPGGMLTKKRSHIIVDIQDRTSGKVFRVASCHLLDPRDFSVEKKGAHVEAVIQETNAPAAYPIDCTIIAGDMNQDEFGNFGSVKPLQPGLHLASAFAPFFQNGFLADDHLDSSEFEKKALDNSPLVSKGRRIDWIWAKGAKPIHLPFPEFDLRGSDHRMVMVSI